MKHIVSFIYLMILTITAISQNSEIVVTRKYTQKDGLSSYNVRRIIQDKNGLLWVATQSGLNRYDGSTFINYTKNAALNHRLCGIDIREIIEDSSENLLWVLPGETGLNVINTITGDVLKTILIPSESIEDWNICMLKDNDHLWIGTSTGIKIYDIQKDKFELNLPLPSPVLNSTYFEVRSLIKDPYGNICVCYSGYGIVIYDSKTLKIINKIPLSLLNNYLQSNNIRFFKCILAPQKKIILATSQGLRQIQYTQPDKITIDNFPCKSIPDLNKESIDYILNSNGKILIAGFNNLYRFDSTLSTYTILSEPSKVSQTDWLNSVQCIYTDSKNDMWLGCQEGLAFVSKEKPPFRPFNYDKITNTKLDHVRSIYSLPNGDILVGLRNGIVHIDHATNVYTKYDTSHLYTHIYQDHNGFIHISRQDGMFIFNNGNIIPISKIYPEFFPYSSICINSHLFINDSLIILGSENNNGILIWNPIKKSVRKIARETGPNNLSSSIVNNIYKDSKNKVWVLSDNIISILSQDLKTEASLTPRDENSKIPYKLFFDMCEAKGCYWIASYGTGLLQLDSSYHVKKRISLQNGLSNEGVYKIYNLSNKYLLVTTDFGLSVMDLNTFQCKNYFEEDGLHSNGFEEACGSKSNGYIFAGGVNGFTVIDPSRFTANKTAPVFYFKNTRMELEDKIIDTSNLYLQSIDIPNNWLRINISFVGLNYTNPDRVTYQYRIKELNNSWINLGTQNFINLIGLKPDTYTLEVKAANEDGYWSDAKKLILVFEPKWYQTIWFKIIILLTTVGLFYAFYRYRISQIKKQHLIRKNIASDLHDDIGSTLNSVKVFTHLAKIDTQKAGYLDEIEDALSQATIGLRDMIWVLDDSQDTVSELLERIKKFALPVITANGLYFHCKADTEEHSKVLSKTEKRNLLLMSKEIINNSIKYAECKNIEVIFKTKKDLRLLLIKDDGKGFINDTNSEGNGLKNLCHRAEQIGYKVEIVSSPGNGTTVKIEKK